MSASSQSSPRITSSSRCRQSYLGLLICTPRLSSNEQRIGLVTSSWVSGCLEDAVVEEWIRILKEGRTEEEMDEFLCLFYADDGLLVSTNPELLQKAFDILSNLFDRMGLHTNAKKTKAMVCLPGNIRAGQSTISHKSMLGQAEEGKTAKQWATRNIKCPICNKEMQASSLRRHLQTLHGTDPQP